MNNIYQAILGFCPKIWKDSLTKSWSGMHMGHFTLKHFAQGQQHLKDMDVMYHLLAKIFI